MAPGAATALGGLLLIVAGNRVAAMLGGWLAVLAGAWFVVGGQLAPLLGIGSAGDPIAATERKRALLEVTYFSGLGALIIFVGGVVLARTSARLARDVQPLASDAPGGAGR
ncbi:putative membrane protein [Mycobacterium avium subsp. avium 2285 (R)]|nr:putative membrane protein [Mycobacterium avium subsp. avium 2285 (R)]